ncbi:hypothetical protein [Paenibacillus illinoisensis]|uniref:hypothetical protein n=1 Tax=Paenibacillus illinoisensis TaxID=59845 RepID=UPI003D953C4F
MITAISEDIIAPASFNQRGNRLVRGFCCCFVIPTSRAAEGNASRLQPPPDWARYA